MFSDIFTLWEVPLENWMRASFVVVVVSVIEVMPNQFRSRLCLCFPQILPLLMEMSLLASPLITWSLVVIPILLWRLTLHVGARPFSSGVASMDICSQEFSLRGLGVIMFRGSSCVDSVISCINSLIRILFV